MRPIKTLLALSVMLVAFFAAAAQASAQTPFVEAEAATGHPGAFTIDGTVNTYGAEADVWVNYFPMVLTTDCTSNPNPDDMMSMVQSDPVSIGAFDGNRSVSVDVTGLPNESSYCYQLVARNTDMEEATTYFWSVETTAPNPELADVTYDAGTNSISYQVALTANTNQYIADVEAEYFAKGSESCGDYTGATTSAQYWGEDWNGFTGFTPQTVGTTISGLSTDTTYCIRLKASNGHGNATPTAWQEVSTVSPIAASVSGIQLAPPSGSNDADLKLTMNDHGAAAAEGASSDYDIYLYDVGAGRCNAQDYFGGDLITGWSGQFDGQDDFSVQVSGLELGKPYCVTVDVNSAWGASYDTTVHQEVWYGQDPQIEAGTAAATHNSISIPGTSIDPGHLATDYGVEYFVKQPDVACSDDSTTQRQNGSTSTISTGLDSSAAVTPSVSGLTPLTTYCFRIDASNKWSSTSSNWDSITTTKQPVAATITNLHIGENSSGAQLVRLYATLDDGAPAAESTWSLQAWSGDCFSGSPSDSVLNQSLTQAGEISRAVGYATVGQSFCVEVSIDSGFGDAYDAAAYLSYATPGMPELTGLHQSSSQTSITVGGNLSATFTATTYHLEWFKPTVDGCSESATPTVSTDQVFSPNNAAGGVSATATGLTPNTRYCARLVASNAWGDTSTFMPPFLSVTTLAQTQPSEPAGGPPCDTSLQLMAFQKTVYKSTLKKSGKSKKFTVTLTSTLVGANLEISTKVAGIPKKNVTLKFNGKKISASATLKAVGTLAVTMPKGAKKVTKKLQVLGAPGC